MRELDEFLEQTAAKLEQDHLDKLVKLAEQYGEALEQEANKWEDLLDEVEKVEKKLPAVDWQSLRYLLMRITEELPVLDAAEVAFLAGYAYRERREAVWK